MDGTSLIDAVAQENEKRQRKSGLVATHNTHYYP